jgi:Domain of unknown function (DUF4157)
VAATRSGQIRSGHSGSAQHAAGPRWSIATVPVQAGPATVVQRKCAGCEEENQVQRAPAAAASPGVVPPIVGDVLRGSGDRLDGATRSGMEAHFGADFSDVRVHTDVRAARSARAIDALAYTVGRDVVFAQGRYAPGSDTGQRLIAHELAHVVQQRGTTPALDRLALDGPGESAAEHEAQAAAASIVTGGQAGPIRAWGGGTIQRDRGSPAGGCGLCFGGNLGDVGTLAHQRVEETFTAAYGGFLMTELELRAIGLAPSPGDENGVLDLAHLSGPGKISIGEIKPANAGGLLEADRDLLWYELQLERRGFTVDRLMLQTPGPLLVGAVPFPTRAPPDCLQFQSLFCDPPVTPGGIYLYWCSPDFKELIATCDCTDGPRVTDKVKEKAKETEKTDTDTQTDKKPQDKPKGVDDGEKDDEQEDGEKDDDKPEDEPGKVIPLFPRPKPVPPEVLVPIAAAIALFLAAQVAKKNPYVRAGLAVLLVVALAEGRAEASPGLDEGDPIEALFGKGSALPPELKEMVEADPKLKQLVTDGAKTGDFTAAQEDASRQAMQVVNDNLDQFTDEELAQMFAVTESATTVAPSLAPTAAGLKKALEAHRAAKAAGGSGQSPGGDPGKTAGGGGKTDAADPTAKADPASTLPPDVSARLAGESASILTLYRTLRSGPGDGPPITGTLVTRFLDLVEPLNDAQRAQLQASAVPGSGETEDQFIAALQQAITKVGAGSSGSAGGPAPGGAAGGTTQATATDGPAAATPAPGSANAAPPQADPDATLQALIAQIVEQLKQVDASTLNSREVVFGFQPSELQKPGTRVAKFVYGKDVHGTVYGAVVTLTVEKIAGGRPVVSVTSSSVVVTAAGVVANDGSMMVQRYRHITVTQPPGGG